MKSNLKKILKQKKITIKELAKSLGMSENGIKLWCSGVFVPRPYQAKKLLDLLDVELDEIFEPNYSTELKRFNMLKTKLGQEPKEEVFEEESPPFFKTVEELKELLELMKGCNRTYCNLLIVIKIKTEYIQKYGNDPYLNHKLCAKLDKEANNNYFEELKKTGINE